MLTGPIFSQEEEDEMMNLSDFRDRPRFEDSHEQSRGTVILEGEDEEEEENAVVSHDFVPSPHVVPQDYSRQEYAFSFDFSAPTHVYSLQFSPPEDQNVHDGEETPTGGARTTSIQCFLKKNQLFFWVAALVFIISGGIQQLLLVKNDVATLRLENQQLRLTIETLQQERLNKEPVDEYTFFQMFEHGFPAETTSKLGECATEAKNQLFHHLADLKDTFWTTAEHVRDVIEDELIGTSSQKVDDDDAPADGEYLAIPWFRRDGLKEKVDKVLKKIGGAKIVIPVLLASGAAVAAEWFWNNED